MLDNLMREASTPWLDESFAVGYRDVLARVALAEPLRPALWYDYYLSRPSVQIGHASLRAFKARHGLQWEAPLVDRRFLGSLKASVSWHGYRGRRHLLHTFFPDLPPEILDRRSKASFNSALFGEHTRAFAEQWNGDGVPEGVNAEWLKEHWQSAHVSARTASLLHHVWLAVHRNHALTAAPSLV
jgi:asparagine synthase (glutamine-hydrolysing)